MWDIICWSYLIDVPFCAPCLQRVPVRQDEIDCNNNNNRKQTVGVDAWWVIAIGEDVRMLYYALFAHIKHFITCRFTALFSTTSRRQWFEVLCKMCHCVSMMTYVFVSVCVWLWEEIWLWFLQIDYSNSFIPSDYKRIPVLNFLSLELNSIPTQSRQRWKTRNHLFPVVKLIISTHCYYC